MSDTNNSGTEQIVSEIREFVESVEDADKWTVTVPVGSFDGVKERLNTESDVGTFYRGVRLCYSPHHDDTRVKCTEKLSEYIRSVDTDTEQ